MGPVLASGADQRTAMELASQLATDFLPLVDRALMGIYRRQQELVWIEDMVEDIERSEYVRSSRPRSCGTPRRSTCTARLAGGSNDQR
jgi:hypothetical protein